MTLLTFVILTGSLLGSVLAKSSVLTVSADTIINNMLKFGKDIANISYKLDNTEASLSSKLETVSARLAVVEEGISLKDSQLKNLTNIIGKIQGVAGSVSFEVRLKKSGYASFGHKEILKFDDVTLNRGQAYNPKTGIFTAPVTGTYIFWASILSGYEGYFHVGLYKNGTLIVQGYTGSSVHHGSIPITYITRVNKGEHMWFGNVERGAKTLIHGYLNSNYGGTLLTTITE